jgi:hypothetical protein
MADHGRQRLVYLRAHGMDTLVVPPRTPRLTFSLDVIQDVGELRRQLGGEVEKRALGRNEIAVQDQRPQQDVDLRTEPERSQLRCVDQIIPRLSFGRPAGTRGAMVTGGAASRPHQSGQMHRLLVLNVGVGRQPLALEGFHPRARRDHPPGSVVHKDKEH